MTTCEPCAGRGYIVTRSGPTDMDECGFCHGSGYEPDAPANLEVVVTYLNAEGTSWLATLDLTSMVVTPLFPVEDTPSIAEQDEMLAEYPLYDNEEVDY